MRSVASGTSSWTIVSNPLLAGAPPDRDGVVEALGDDDLLPPNAAANSWPSAGLTRNGGSKTGRSNGLLVARQHGPGSRHAGLLGLEHEDLLAAQPARDLGVVGQRHVGDLAHLVPAVEDELDVLVALREEDDATVAGDAAQGVQQRVAGVPEAVVAEQDALARRSARRARTRCRATRCPVTGAPARPSARTTASPAWRSPKTTAGRALMRSAASYVSR